MFKHILVPVDGSSTANQALEKAAAIAKAFQSAVTVVSVIDLYAFVGLGGDAAYGQAEYLEAATAEAHSAIKNAKAFFETSGLAVTTTVIEGQVTYKSILEAADSAQADLIVMGSHGRKGLESWCLAAWPPRFCRIPTCQ